MTTRTLRNLRAPLLIVILLTAAGADLNSPVKVGHGETREGDLASVNGTVTIGDGATVLGECSSVNGGITVGRDARVKALTSVNGSVKVDVGTLIEDEVQSINGKIVLGAGVRSGSVSTINGKIDAEQVEIDRDVRTINGDILLRDRSLVHGSIIVEEANRRSERERPLKIEIRDGSVVEGGVVVEDPEIEVKVYLRGGGRVLGSVKNAEVIEE